MRRSVLAALLLLAAASAPAESGVIAVLPLSGAGSRGGVVEGAIAARLAERGWRVVPAEEVEHFLEERRIRYLDSLTGEQLSGLRERTGAQAVVVGSLLAWREGPNPLVAVAARMVAGTGEVVWGQVVAISASESEGALGLGRPADAVSLAGRVARRLLEDVPQPGQSRTPGLNAPRFAAGPVTYRSAAHPRGTVRRVCILPIVSQTPDASRVAVEILTIRLAATGEFELVEPAHFREAMRNAGMRSVASMTSDDLLELSQVLGTTLFLRGNVHALREAGRGASEIQFDMTLADVASGEIVWAVTHHRRGGDYAGLFNRGVVENAVSLADRALSEAVSEQHRARPRGPAGRSAARMVRKEE